MAIKQIDPAQAHATLAADPETIYLDVRTEEEFAQGHPSGAINIPVVFLRQPGQPQPNPDFLSVAQKILPRDKRLIIGCLSGMRSQRACEILEQAGYRDLSNMQGGFGGSREGAGWRDSGLPVSNELGDLSYQALRTKAGL
jgi:rhodanese-related sulfurtransferase